jgi:hypothetical protein
MESEVQYWFNTKTGLVESGPQSLSLDRIGPFSSFDEAKRALQIIDERAKNIAADEELED